MSFNDSQLASAINLAQRGIPLKSKWSELTFSGETHADFVSVHDVPGTQEIRMSGQSIRIHQTVRTAQHLAEILHKGSE